MKKLIPILMCCAAVVGCQAPVQQAAPSQDAFSFGVIADIQYADKEHSGTRYYRTSEQRLQECVDELNRHDLAFTIQLGDLIDGNDTPEATLADLDHIMDIHGSLTMPTYHVIGNHCLTAGEEALHQKLKLDAFYYDFAIPEAPGWRFVVLDGNDGGYGMIAEAQLTWLEARLSEASAQQEKVIIFCHYALLKDAAPAHRMKESQPVLQIINASGCVVAYFAGHQHTGGYAYQNGIHHITVKGMVEAPEQNAYAILEVHSGQIIEKGYGAEPSRELDIARE